MSSSPPPAPKTPSGQVPARKKEGRKMPRALLHGTSVSMSKKAADDGAVGLCSGDLFARNLSLMSVAHIARGVGYKTIEKSAADVLAELVATYIQRIGRAAKERAELAGRAQPKASDVVQAFYELEPAAVELKDLVQTLETAKWPFPRDVPAFPAKKRDMAGKSLEPVPIGRREGLPPHVPCFLPPLPNRHTYSAETRLVVEREQDIKRQRLGLLSEKAQVRQSLHGLQTVAAKTPVRSVRPPTWNAFQGSIGDNATENPFVQAPLVTSVAKTLFSGPARDFVPQVDRDSAPSTNELKSHGPIPKLSSQEQGKEEKILSGTFHDGDSE